MLLKLFIKKTKNYITRRKQTEIKDLDKTKKKTGKIKSWPRFHIVHRSENICEN